jgi:aspartyl protease family protein
MSLSSGQKHLVSELLSWGALTVLLVAVAFNFSDLRRMLSDAVIGQIIENEAKGQRATIDDTPQGQRKSGDGVELRANRAGHFEATFEINGRPIEALIDTGATLVVLRYEDAQQTGVSPRAQDFNVPVQTANGRAKVALVNLDRISIGSIQVRDVKAAVAERGALQTNLLGMSFLQRLKGYEFNSGRLTLKD